MSASARLIQVFDGRILWNAEQIEYESAGAASSLWVARDSDLLKAEIAHGLESLARQNGETLFVKRGIMVRGGTFALSSGVSSCAPNPHLGQIRDLIVAPKGEAARAQRFRPA